jgi:hypothetical protein
VTRAFLTKKDPDAVLASPTPMHCIRFDGVARFGFDVGSIWHLRGLYSLSGESDSVVSDRGSG